MYKAFQYDHLQGKCCSHFVLDVWHHNNVNSSPPEQNRRHFADNIFKHVFLNENIGISIQISLKFVPKGPIDNKSALVRVMALNRRQAITLFHQRIDEAL